MLIKRNKWMFLLVLGLLLMFVQASIAGAAGRDRLRWTADCDGFTSQGGGIIFNRDNTGQGREVIVITAVDGNGNTIFGPVEESSFVGSSLYIAPGITFPYAAAPAANPIRVTVTSPAGNGFGEQVVYATLGSCATLDFVAAPDLDADEDGFVDLFVPSGSVPLNGTPPRPLNPDNLGLTETGYLLVTEAATVNLRSGDGTEFTIVGQVEAGDQLFVTGRNADRSWWFVRVGDVRGWVNGELVVVRGDLTGAPEVPVFGEIFPPRFFVFTEQPIRALPVDNAFVLCEIPGGLEYEIIGKNVRGSWFLIRAMCDDVMVEGWISGELGALRNSGDLPIPIVD
mgnify:CR=1 FL=1